ncbi:tetratricopeptide repeat protein [Clostridium gasigenes]|uniref:Tetratricopeptide repeat protein n=1 Tax=Clostridium gasigenes TaxID=94869 RepID=A0A7X0SC09_9CLOT|nr:tetratricopeptide repeat protein [Clostridium gasigenes]
MGKTQVCVAYFNEYKNNYKHIGWIDYIGNIKESFIKQVSSNTLILSKGEAVDDQYKKVLQFLHSLDENTLLVIDNIQNLNDENLKDIRKLPFNVLINSRIRFEGFEKFTIDFLSMSKCKELFYRNYSAKADDIILEKIIELAGRHTLTIELLAKTAENAVLTISELHDMLEKEGFNIAGVKEAVYSFCNGECEKLLFYHILKVFDLSQITTEEKNILMNISILPSIEISINALKDWIGIESSESINSLIKKGWINKIKHNVIIHPLIQETIRYKEKPNVHICRILIQSITEKLNVKYTENPLLSKDYSILASYILKCIKEDCNEIAILNNNLAMMYMDLGILNESLELQLEAVRIKEILCCEDNYELAEFYKSLSKIYQHLGELKNSLEIQLIAIEMMERIFGENSNKMIPFYDSLAMIHLDRSELNESLEVQLKSIRIQENILDEVYSSKHIAYSNISVIYRKIGYLNDSFKYQVKALNIIEKKLKREHPEVIRAYDILAMIYLDLGEREKSFEISSKNLKLAENIFDENNIKLGYYYEHFAAVCRVTGNTNEALKLQLKAIKIKEKVLLSDNASIATSYSNLACIYVELIEIQKALYFESKATNIREKILGENDIDLGYSYNNLARIHYELGDFESALEYQLKDVRIVEFNSYKNNPELAKSYNNLAMIYYYLGYKDKSIDIQNRAINIQKYNFTDNNRNHPDLINSYKILEFISK